MPATPNPDVPAFESPQLEPGSRPCPSDPILDAALAEACRLAALVCGCPGAAVELLGPDHVRVAAAVGMAVGCLSRAGSVAERLIGETGVVAVSDVALDPRFADLAAGDGASERRFLAAAPLRAAGGDALGSLVVWDSVSRVPGRESLDSLAGLGRLVEAQLHLQRRQHQLEQLETSHARVEAKLREAESKYRGMFENIVVGIYQTTPDGRYLAANPMLAEIYGYGSPDELIEGIGDIGDQIYEDPGMRERFKAALAQSDRISNFEARIRRKDGSVIWIVENARVVREADGRVRCYEGTVQDITARKAAEEQLRNAEHLYHRLVEELPQNVFRKDLQERFILANQRFCETVGRRIEDILGRTDYDLFPEELARKYQADDQRVMAEGRTVRFTERNLGADGKEHWVEVIKTPLRDVNGATIGIQGIFWDVTEMIETERALRVAEEKFRTMVENSVEGIYQTSPEGKFLSVNPALVRIYRYASEEDLKGRLTDVRTQAYVKPGRREEFTTAVLAAGSVTGFESEVVCGDGSTTWISESARPVRDRDGKLLYFEGTVEDISARKQIETEREKTRQAAEESARQKAEFLATVSHEIRTPLNAIVPNTAMLADTELDQHQRNLVESIDTGARMLLQIVNDVLDFMRSESGALRLEELDFDLYDVVERSLAAFGALAREKNLELVGDLHPDLPRYVRGDSARLGQVLNNLLGNALKFTQAGEVCLAVEPGPRIQGRHEIRFAVRDTGIGIPDEARSRVFQAFAQADGSMSRRFGGTGLGLAITRRYVELMGGAIDFESQVGVGTTFRFHIRPGVATSFPPSAALPSPRPLAGLRILVLDDHPLQLRVLADTLASLGADSTRTASDLPSALDQLRTAAVARQPVDLVFFDPSAARKDVKQLARDLRGVGGTTRLIAVVPRGVGMHDRSLGALGIVGTLVKPLRRSRVATEVEAILTGRRPGSTPAEAGSPMQLATPAAPGRGCRVLLVEDNPLNQRVAVQLLERLEATVDAVADGREALQAFQERAYDLILMDCQLPGMDGYETTQRIRQREAEAAVAAGPGETAPRVPIVALSANAFQDDRDRGLAAGMDDYVTKPLSQAELVRVLQSLREPRPAHGSAEAPITDPPGPAKDAVADGPPEDPVLDPTPLQALASPDEPHVIREFVAQYLAEAPRRLEQIREAVAAADGPRIKAEAHLLKGSSSYMGLRRLVAACAALEIAGRDGDASAWSTLERRVGAEFDAGRDALEALAAEGKGEA